MNNRGQFSIIAALLVAIILAGTLIAVYATVHYGSSQSQTPQTLTATGQTNAALLKALGFTVGYYGSILQVTGNQTYAYANATTYMNSALQYIASMNPSLGENINMTSLSLSNNWFSNPSISTGKLSVVYDLAALGIYGVNYTTSCSLGVQIFNSPNSNQVRINVTQDLTEPLTSLGQQNFNFYFYNYSTTNWQLLNPTLPPTISTNGTYLINVPSGIDSSAYMVQVTDSRGIMVEASSFNSYNMNFTFSATSSSCPAIVELLQNGTMRWFGQDLLSTTTTRPIPPVSISSLHLCQTGYTSDIPFQVEDWASQYQIPLSMSSNYTIFSNSQMIVFEVMPSMSQLTLWWNGSDTAIQTTAAFTDTYFTADNPIAGTGTLSNGNITLQFSYPGGAFQIKSTIGTVSSTATFMRIDASASTYGSSSPNYVIHNGVVRDIVQEEAEWTNGPTNSPNVYSPIVFTLPANATYYTYQLRIIYINSSITRNINDIDPIQLTTSVSQVQAMTENGTLNGIPNVTNGTGTFNNSTGRAHHWSQLINNVTLQGTGIMFTDNANQQLYAFDSMAGKFTGALYVSSSTPVIELDPVTSAGPVSFSSALDLTWSGAVDTFNGIDPIFANNGTTGSWPVVEQPPSITFIPQSSAATSIALSPSIGPVGTSVTISGGGYIPNSQIRITFNGNTVATTTATAYGVIPSGIIFVIPSSTMPGSYPFTATDTSSNSASEIFIIPGFYGPLDHFVFNNISSPQTAGSAFSITITAKDASGSSVTSYNSSVPLSVSVGSISPTSTGNIGWSSGVWTGSVTLTAAGSGITITANDGSGHTGTSNSFTVNPGYITIAITNTQSSATPSTFQQKISWNPSNYTSYETSNLGNIRFYSDSALTLPLYAWIESSSPSLSNTATSATAWIKLTSQIAGSGGTLTIYMAFLSNSKDFDGNYWGTAPNLSPTYGQYDNGANVFNFYDNFAGTTISSAWNTAGAAGTYSVNNGLNVYSGAFPGYTFTLNNQYTGPLIIDAYQVGTSGDWIGASFSNLQTTDGSYSFTSGAIQWLYPPQGPWGSCDGLYTASGGTAFTPNPPSTTLQVVTLAVNSTAATEYQNYANPVTASGTISLTNYPGIVQLAYNTASDTQTTYWFRIRAYTESDVMPSVSLGGLV